VHLLEEAIYSFLLQDYHGSKELIILNDFTAQELHYEADDVHVFNAAARLPTLGDKRNATARLATGELLLTWGDDDIHLPHRISRMVRAMQSFQSPIVREGCYYCIYAGKITLERGSTTGANIVEKDSFWECGAIPSVNCGEDRDFNERIKAFFGMKQIPVASESPAFVYRFSGTQRTHISSLGDDLLGKKSGYEIMLEHANKLVSEGKEPSGAVILKPTWRADYIKLTAPAGTGYELTAEP